VTVLPDVRKLFRISSHVHRNVMLGPYYIHFENVFASTLYAKMCKFLKLNCMARMGAGGPKCSLSVLCCCILYRNAKKKDIGDFGYFVMAEVLTDTVW
jgi:hypothetical protein